MIEILYFCVIKSMCLYLHRKKNLHLIPSSKTHLTMNSCIQVGMHARDILALTEGVSPVARSYDCSRYCMRPARNGIHCLWIEHSPS